jgi:ABC-type branched-subunit amino acid transport system substrate-binding protein
MLTFSTKLDRRSVVKGAVAAGALQVTSPFIIGARGETPLRIGMVDPLTGVYAAVAQNEVMGARLAVEQINSKGGILGRPIELLVEDSANDVGTGVQKARKLAHSIRRHEAAGGSARTFGRVDGGGSRDALERVGG